MHPVLHRSQAELSESNPTPRPKRPRGHLLHILLPPIPHVPDSHTTQRLLLNRHLPGKQDMHSLAPGEEMRPARHAAQSIMVELCRMVCAVPAGHRAQDTEPVCALYVPNPHGRQWEDATFGASLPSGQSGHDMDSFMGL